MKVLGIKKKIITRLPLTFFNVNQNGKNYENYSRIMLVELHLESLLYCFHTEIIASQASAMYYYTAEIQLVLLMP